LLQLFSFSRFTTAQQYKKLIKEQAACLYFAAFVNIYINEGSIGFNKNILSGSIPDFQAKLDIFIRDLKVYITEFVEKTYRKEGLF
jgi:hypothetical protein